MRLNSQVTLLLTHQQADAQDPQDADDVLDLSGKIEYSYEQVRSERERRKGEFILALLQEGGQEGMRLWFGCPHFTDYMLLLKPIRDWTIHARLPIPCFS